MTSARRNRAAETHAAAIMVQAPMVIWMRLPLLFLEMAKPWSFGARAESERMVVEKIGAGLEAAGKLQIEFARMWTEMAIGMMSGAVTTGTASASRIERYHATALEPYARRVRGNASRLKRRAKRPYKKR